MAAVGRWAPLSPLNQTATSQQNGTDEPAAGAIRLERLLTDPGVVSFWLPATVEPATARVIPRLFIRQLVAFARRLGPEPQQVYVIIDEAPETLQRSLSPVLKQARDLKISVRLAFQNLCDLEASGPGMADVVLGNTSIRIFFSASDPTARDYLPLASGEVSCFVRRRGRTIPKTFQGTNVGNSRSSQETIRPRITQEHLNWVNAREGLCVLEAAPHSGFCCSPRFDFSQT